MSRSNSRMVKITHISMKAGIGGSGWSETFNMYAACKPEEVTVQKKIPRSMSIEVSTMEVVKGSGVHKRALKTSAKGGKIDWKESGYMGGVKLQGMDRDIPVRFLEPLHVSIPLNAALLVND